MLPTLTNVDVVINAVELNHRHGVGILINRIFTDSAQIITLRTENSYQGDSPFGIFDYVLGARDVDRSIIKAKIEAILAGYQVNRILCIPYYTEELLMALAVRELTDAPICTYLMDDRNVLVDGVPDDVMTELLQQSALRLGISPEMCDVYAGKYNLPIHFAPPILPPELVNTEIPRLSPDDPTSQRGAMIGNVWSPIWLQLLREMTRNAGVQLDWYGNTGANWYIKDRSQLTIDGIVERGFFPTEMEVAAVLRGYPYVVVPSGTLDSRDDNLATSWLSLPSRIPFILATSNTPIIVLGSRNTAAARFVERLKIGVVADYDFESFRTAVGHVTQPEVQLQMRQNAASYAPLLINNRMDEWIWQSLEAGEPIDLRFAKLCTYNDYTGSFMTCLDSIKGDRAQLEKSKSPLSISKLRTKYREYRNYFRKLWLGLN